MSAAEQLRDDLQGLVAAGRYAEASTKAAEAKLMLLTLQGPTDEASRVVSLQVLELGVLLAVHAEDAQRFQRYISQLKPYYADLESRLRPTILGLHLLFLIVENRLAEFHAELELLSEADRACDEVAFAISLEQNLMVGTYNEVLQAKMPSPEHFSFFMGRLRDTVRETVAECAEVSYDSLSLEAAREMMMFDTSHDLVAFIRNSHADWRVQGDRIFFDAPANQPRGREIPSVRLLTENLAYATELERIV
ncbi:hypothetical protein CTAYLR_009349 [Chrysophaeum taylorii]|uniref:CSN8/PSMD8/EIF3K domain-containing protein n=1 Tax=Chrysophaeum taylorii TaxID=2483200 RepID=A0AAD7UJ76_9STRA|nr:hypothetical protein CTAYLR_009349 [Chrysophaeum taylorii]